MKSKLLTVLLIWPILGMSQIVITPSAPSTQKLSLNGNVLSLEGSPSIVLPTIEGVEVVTNTPYINPETYPQNDAASFTDVNGIGSWDNSNSNVAIDDFTANTSKAISIASNGSGTYGEQFATIDLTVENGESYILKGWIASNHNANYATVRINSGTVEATPTFNATANSPYEYIYFEIPFISNSSTVQIRMGGAYNGSADQKQFVDRLTLEKS